MVTIAITPEAFSIIVATLPDGCKAKLRPDGKGGYQATLPNGALDQLTHAPGTGGYTSKSLDAVETSRCLPISSSLKLRPAAATPAP